MGRKVMDLVGREMGAWTVLSQLSERDAIGRVLWLCRCTCGTERVVVGNNLRVGQSKSCGCVSIKKMMARIATKTEFKNKLEDLTGRQINRWLVIEIAERIGRTRYWLCQCECGTLKKVNGANLKNGCSRSCGCLRKEN